MRQRNLETYHKEKYEKFDIYINSRLFAKIILERHDFDIDNKLEIVHGCFYLQ